MEHLKLAMPGLALIAIQLIGIVVPQIFYLVNPVYLWIAICTVGLPCLFISFIFWALRLFKLFKKTYVFRIFLAISLIITTIPSMSNLLRFVLSESVAALSTIYLSFFPMCLCEAIAALEVMFTKSSINLLSKFTIKL